MHRAIIYDGEQIDPFDVLWQFKDSLTAIGWLGVDLAGETTTMVAGLGAAQTSSPSLAINLGAGRIYAQAPIDPTAYGVLPSDSTVVQQQGIAAAQSVTLSTSALTSGQSQWALIQATFSTSDVVRAGDPTGGVLNYWDSANPTQWFQGPNGNGLPQPTERQASITISVVYGTPASTGSEAPPNPESGCVPLYLIDLSYGQTAITNAEILKAGPSVGSNVPSNYPGAPIIAGLLNRHHLGIPGTAPMIELGSEVQGVLTAANGGIGGGTTPPVYLKFVSTTQIALAPKGGQYLPIAGAYFAIPSGGLTSGLTGVYVGGAAAQNLAASTVYDVYAFNNAGAVALDFWAVGGTEGHGPDTTAGNVGVEVRTVSGAPQTGWTYLGKIATDATPHFQAQGVGVLSWFNRQPIAFAGPSESGTTTGSTPIEVNTAGRASFLSWAGSVELSIIGSGTNTTNGDTFGASLAVDGAGLVQIFQGPVSGSQLLNIAMTISSAVAEGSHYSTLLGATGGAGTASFTNFGCLGLTFG